MPVPGTPLSHMVVHFGSWEATSVGSSVVWLTLTSALSHVLELISGSGEAEATDSAVVLLLDEVLLLDTFVALSVKLLACAQPKKPISARNDVVYTNFLALALNIILFLLLLLRRTFYFYLQKRE